MTVGTQVEMVRTETTGAVEATTTGVEVGYGAGPVPLLYGDGEAETAGAEVAITGKVVVLTTVERAGQLVTVAAHEVMVTSLVVYTIDSETPAMTAVAKKATEAIVNCILNDLIWRIGLGRGYRVKC